MFSKIKLKVQKLEWNISGSGVDPKEANFFSDIVQPYPSDEIDITEYLMSVGNINYELETIDNNELYFQEQNFDVKLSGIHNNSFLTDYFNINGNESRNIIKKYKVTLFYDNIVKFRGFIEQKALSIEYSPNENSEIINATVISMTNEFKNYYDKKPLGETLFNSNFDGISYSTFYNYMSTNISSNLPVRILGDVQNWCLSKDAIMKLENDKFYYIRGGWSRLERDKVSVYEFLKEICLCMGWVFYIYNNELIIRPRSTTLLSDITISEEKINKYKKSFDSNYSVFSNVVLNSAFYHNENFPPEVSKYNGSTVIDISNQNYYFNIDPIGKMVDTNNFQENRNVTYLNVRDDKNIEYTTFNKTGNSTINYISNSTFETTSSWSPSVSSSLSVQNNRGVVTTNIANNDFSLSTTINVPSSSYYYLTFNGAIVGINQPEASVKQIISIFDNVQIESKIVLINQNYSFGKSFFMESGTHTIRIKAFVDSGNPYPINTKLSIDDVYLYQVVDGKDKTNLPKYSVLDLNNKTTHPKYVRYDFNNGVVTNWEPGIPMDSRDFAFAGTYGDMLFKPEFMTNEFGEQRLYSYQEYVKTGVLYENYKKFLNQTYLEKAEIELDGMYDELLTNNLRITGNGKLNNTKWSINKFEVDYINEITKAEIQKLNIG